MPSARARNFWPRNFQRCVCLPLLLGVAGCAGMNDPFQRTGTWRAEHVNDDNLAAMVADPRHLVQGVGDDSSPGVLSAAAVRRLLTDHVKPLPATNFGPVGNTQTPASAGGDASGAAATGGL